MKKKVQVLVISTLFLFGISGCKDGNFIGFESEALKDEILIPSTAKISNIASLREDNSSSHFEIEEFARLLAISLKDREMRVFLKNEANKQFDGDFDILVGKIINTNVGDGSFSEKIKHNALHGAVKSQEIIDNVLKNNRLNISIPVHFGKWNPNFQSPLVAVAIDAIESETKLLKAFDSNGKLYLIDANLEPNLPVIIVGINERVDDEGILKTKFGVKSSLLRQENSPEYVYSMKVDDVGDIESWWNGEPEIKCVISGYRFGAVVSPIWSGEWTPGRATIEQEYIPNTFTFTWTADYGNYLSYTWLEEDFAGPDRDVVIPISYQATSGGATATYSTTLVRRREDKVLAQGEIWKGESKYQQYSGSYGFRYKLSFND